MVLSSFVSDWRRRPKQCGINGRNAFSDCIFNCLVTTAELTSVATFLSTVGGNWNCQLTVFPRGQWKKNVINLRRLELAASSWAVPLCQNSKRHWFATSKEGAGGTAARLGVCAASAKYPGYHPYRHPPLPPKHTHTHGTHTHTFPSSELSLTVFGEVQSSQCGLKQLKSTQCFNGKKLRQGNRLRLRCRVGRIFRFNTNESERRKTYPGLNWTW